jgi:hypothetical protein
LVIYNGNFSRKEQQIILIFGNWGLGYKMPCGPVDGINPVK